MYCYFTPAAVTILINAFTKQLKIAHVDDQYQLLDLINTTKADCNEPEWLQVKKQLDALHNMSQAPDGVIEDFECDFADAETDLFIMYCVAKAQAT